MALPSTQQLFLFVETVEMRLFLRHCFFTLPAIEFCDFCCRFTPLWHPTPLSSTASPSAALLPSRAEKFAWLLGSGTDFHAARNTIMGWNEAERYFRPV